MGGCQSVQEPNSGARPPPQRQGGATRTNHTRRNNNNNNNNNKQDNIQSLVRVGSKVLKESDVPNGGLHVGRASTYDHVHNVVLTNFESASNNHNNGKCGLRNLGNTCFMNSALQCLSNTIPLTDYFLGYDYRKEINHDNFLGTQGKLVNAYMLLMKQMWLSSQSTCSLDPSSFYRPLTQFAPDFAGGQQHDSQELLAFLLDGIHEDLNRVRKRPYIEDEDSDGTNDEGASIQAWQNYLLRNRSIVVDLFQGQLRNSMKCSVCGLRRVKFEPFMYLSLPISNQTRTLDQCLELYCETEHLQGDNRWFCSRCQRHVNATKKLDLWMLPPILIIHLKRFGYRGNKIEQRIEYPITNWNLSNSVKSKNGLYPMFDLYAVSNHAGGLDGGHYTAMVKNRFDDVWYEMNDSSTRKINAARELESNPKAYCLFYNRVERLTGATGNNGRKRSDPKIMRQSVDRPELWPHMQLNTNDFKSFRRSTVVQNMPPPLASNGASGATVADMPTIMEAYSA